MSDGAAEAVEQADCGSTPPAVRPGIKAAVDGLEHLDRLLPVIMRSAIATPAAAA